jgi:hypothetical protein
MKICCKEYCDGKRRTSFGGIAHMKNYHHSLWKVTILTLLLVLSAACAGRIVAPGDQVDLPFTTTPEPAATATPTLRPTTTPTSLPEMPQGPLTWSGETRPLLMAHYMPWYQAPPLSGQWGWHWTMNHFSPSQAEDATWTNFASHYTPQIGLYDSSDPEVLDYQVQLMKLSGIDGVIVDWYGMENFWDYGTINASTEKLFQAIKKAGLKFVICYEDQTLKHMVENGHIKEEDAIVHGQEVMQYLQDTWFQDEAYLKVNNQPVLFTFGPQYLKSGEDWQALFDALDPKPLFISLDNPTPGAAQAAYPWPPMWASQGGVLSHDVLLSYLDDFYDKSADWPYRVGGAFPGFEDIYKEANVGPGYGTLDPLDGQTFRLTLQEALDNNPDMVQLITWNDYGEGTIIEPTMEFGNRYLEMVQEARRMTSGGNFPFIAEDLSLPFELYQLRLEYANDAGVLAELEKAAEAILNGELERAKDIMNAVRLQESLAAGDAP